MPRKRTWASIPSDYKLTDDRGVRKILKLNKRTQATELVIAPAHMQTPRGKAALGLRQKQRRDWGFHW